jgi:hypothetical protein
VEADWGWILEESSTAAVQWACLLARGGVLVAQSMQEAWVQVDGVWTDLGRGREGGAVAVAGGATGLGVSRGRLFLDGVLRMEAWMARCKFV